MARPIKPGLDYFPLDVDLDSKFELIEAEFGLNGFGVVVKIFQLIYKDLGYYIEWTDEVALLFAKRVGLGGSAVSEIIESAIRRGMFDQKVFDQYRILTSSGIQKRYFEAVSRRKEVMVRKNILLIDCAQICQNVNIVSINVSDNSQNVNSNTQSKVKESKVKESKAYGVNFEKQILEFTTDEKLQEVIRSFVEHRKQLKKPFTDRALSLLLEKLLSLSGGKTALMINILDQSILCGWTNIFAFKEESNGTFKRNPKQDAGKAEERPGFRTSGKDYSQPL